MELNIYALAKIAIMTDSLHAGCEWSEGEALRRNVDVRRVNARGCTINVYEVQIVPIGTIRIEVGKVRWGDTSRIFTGFATQEHPQPKILCLFLCLSH